MNEQGYEYDHHILIKFPLKNVHFITLPATISPCIEARSEIWEYIGRDLAYKIKSTQIRKTQITTNETILYKREYYRPIPH